MTNDRELDEVLAELGREHRVIGAPETLESVLRGAAGSRKFVVGTRRVRLQRTLTAAAILLAAIAGVIWQSRKSHPSQTQQGRALPIPQARPEPMVPSPREEARQSVPPNAVPVRSKEPTRASLGRASSQQEAWSSLNEFVPLPASEGLPRATELSVVRIKLRGSDLQQYGLQAPVDGVARTMLAEFVVGEDGLPRAIRIVR